MRICVIIFDNKCFKYYLGFIGIKSEGSGTVPPSQQLPGIWFIMFEMSKQLADFFSMNLYFKTYQVRFLNCLFESIRKHTFIL